MIVCVFVSCKDQIRSTSYGVDAGAEDVMESEGEVGIVCEDQGYTEDDLRAVFPGVAAELAAQGHEVGPLTLENEDEFSRFADAMMQALGCIPENASSTRRNGPSGCEVVTEVPEDAPAAGVFYCGEDARRGIGCPRLRRSVGDCLNRVCWQHDFCYQRLIEAQGPICVWSNDTESCDAVFHLGAIQCVQRFQCSFWCLLVAIAAAEIDALQEVGKLEGMECINGGAGEKPPTCTPSPEICDELDNDCDGTVDDLGTTTCGVGVCLHTIDNCAGGQSQTCDPTEGATTENCNADLLDEDCDGGVNEGCACLNGTTRSCGTDLGVCVAGTQTCTSGTWGSCVGEVLSAPEICNGVDDDCDGVVDNGVLNTCVSYDDCSTFTTCATCPVEPSESCNGLDDDCDDEADEDFREPLAAKSGYAALGTPCTRGDTECGNLSEGVYVCAPEGSGTTCDAAPLPVDCTGRCGRVCGAWCYCGTGTTCSANCTTSPDCNGTCTAVASGCSDECSIYDAHRCSSVWSGYYNRCTRIDTDPCLEWSGELRCGTFCPFCPLSSSVTSAWNPCTSSCFGP